MEEHVTKHWPVWALVAFMGFSFYWVAKSWNSGNAIVASDESYEMIRPKTFEPEYDLSGRKIVRNLERQRIASADGPEALREPMSPKAPTAPAKKDNAKAPATKNAQMKKPSLTAQIIASDLKGKSADSMNNADGANNYYPNNYYPQTTETAKPNTQQQQQDETKVTAAQWREILLSSPTVENADKFLAAYKKGDIDQAAFYAIADELLSNADKNRQQAGLQLLSKEFSSTSFELMAKHYNDSRTSSDIKSSLTTTIQSYGQSSRITILAQVLESSDESAASVATEVIASAVSAQGSAQSQGDRGGIRSPGSSAQIDKGTWKGLLSPLQRLSSSGNAELAERAQSLLASIEALTSV